MRDEDLKLNHVYAAKHPRRCGTVFRPVWNDRMIIYIDDTIVQYDSPTVRRGQHYPKVPRDKFLAWAGEDVTAQTPDGDWRPAW